MILAAIVLAAFPLQETPRDWQTPRLQAVLKDLGDFARQVDSGTRTLWTAHTKEGQPDGMLTEIRALVHEYPKLAPELTRFIRSTDSPVMAPALVLVLARPIHVQQERVLPPWQESLKRLRVVSDSTRWRMHEPQEWRSRMSKRFGDAPDDLNLKPLFSGALKLLKRSDLGELKENVLGFALRLVQRKEFGEEERKQIRAHIEDSYLKQDLAWRFSLERLAHSSGEDKGPDLAVLGRGYPDLDVHRQVQVLDAIARRSMDSVFNPPFVEKFEQILEFLGRHPKEGGINLGEALSLVRAIRERVKTDAALKKLLEKDSSMTLRQRIGPLD